MPHNIHDFVFFIGAIILIWGPAKMVYNKIDLPISASLSTWLVLTAFTINYATMSFWYTFTIEVLNSIFWGVLTYRSVKKDNFLLRKDGAV